MAVYPGASQYLPATRAHDPFCPYNSPLASLEAADRAEQ